MTLQFAWWSFHLVQLNEESTRLKKQVIQLTKSDRHVTHDFTDMERRLSARKKMILGEGAVFFLLLIFGFLKVRQTFKREAELNTMQHNFMLSVTHELRSPLASIKLQLETMMLRELDSEKKKVLLSGAMSDSERLENLIENILVASRLENSDMTLHKEKGDLSTFIRAVIEKISFTIRKNHSLNIEIEENIYCQFDRVTFPSIVLNLLENAQKYSPAGTEISLKLFKKNNKVFLRISDQGPGIPDQEKENIFKRFYRIGNEDTRSSKGTGLGLYIVKSLTRLHGGEVTISKAEPHGACFTITLNSI